ncbi:MAG: MarR family transcriptional regulator [Eubacteriales bacterium]|nr:MarR family transcriptional regulator [Eubacteriales bacterium]MDD3074593.1 MarR family transcriptional regulator [Eubacteriales bacterium]MDD4079552.1 MarR family transcriptional regulator [Eubacteriales bacterium]MDD4769557.1 MarR family transcriptional regulator [Eubacteriales bacterium]
MGDSLRRDVYWLLRRTSFRLKAELRKKIEEHGITWPQFHALFHIGEQGLPANELARVLQCNASNMTGLVDRMSESGWVYREHSKEDRRVWLIKLTEEGKKLLAEVQPQHRRNIEERMGRLSDAELKTMGDLLGKLLGEDPWEEN